LLALAILLGLGFSLSLTMLVSAQQTEGSQSTAALSGTVITVNTTDDELNGDGDCSLREAIQAANTDSAVSGCPAGDGWDTINLPAGTYVLTLTGAGEDANATGDLDILDSVTISGTSAAGTILDGNAADRIFDVDPTNLGTTLELQNVTLTNGSETLGGALRQLYGQTVIRDSIIDGNLAASGGGGIYAGQGVVRLFSTTLQFNQVTDAVSYGGALRTNEAIVYLQNSIVYSNTASRGAGLFTQDGSLQLDNSQVFSNTATGSAWGGGIHTDKGTVLVENNSLVSYNQAVNGAGIYANDGAVYIENSTVSHNTATSEGGGLFINDDTSFLIKNSLFEYNRAVNDGGAIFSNNSGHVEDSTFQHNQADSGGAYFAEYTSGMLTVMTSTFYSNTAATDGGAFQLFDSSLAVRRSIILENYAGNDGGGISIGDGYPFIFVEDSLIKDNTAVNNGGGLNISDYDCLLHMERATVTGNQANQGGGLYLDEDCSLQMSNSTFSANTGVLGGGIYLGDSHATTAIEYSTITDNSATTAGGGVYLFDGVGTDTSVFNLRNSILAGNSINGTLNDPTADCSETNARFNSAGHNLLGSGTGCTADPVYDQTVTPADVATSVLFPLADNGGAALPGGLHAPTHALRGGSPAIDDGADLICLETDQTGAGRPQGNGCDVGAIESGFSDTPFVPAPNTITVTAFNDDLTAGNGECSLREAVNNANADADTTGGDCAAGSGWDTILLSSGTYSLTIPSTDEDNNLDGDLDVITGSITFQGAGEGLTIIDANQDDRVFQIGRINALTAIFKDLTLTNGRASNYGGCLWPEFGQTILYQTRVEGCDIGSGSGTGRYGGGIYTDLGALALVSSTVQNNRVSGATRSQGGGIYVDTGPLAIYNSLVYSNTAQDSGGGIYVDSSGALLDTTQVISNTASSGGGFFYGYEAGLIVRDNSLIQYNTSTGSHGGGIHVYEGLLVDDSTISHNTSGSDGGGVNSDGGFWIRNTLVEYNQAGNDGGGLYGDLGGIVENSTFRYNKIFNPQNYGGGLHLYGGGYLTSTLIYSNTAPIGGGVAGQYGGTLIFNSDIRWNTATAAATSPKYGGGGIQHENGGGLLLVRSAVRDNNSAGQGGGIQNNDAAATIIESTISHNTAVSGGGIYANSALALVNSSLSGNNAQSGGGVYNNTGPSSGLYLHFSTVAGNSASGTGGGIFNNGVAVIDSSILAGNSANSSTTDATADCLESSALTFAGYSLFGSATGCSAAAPTDLTVIPATVFTSVLGPLEDNGGPLTASGSPALTHALLPGSLALDYLPQGSSGCGVWVDSDQRGISRPQGDNCDIGAYEREYYYEIYLPFVTRNGP
jgi:CSLREA domain-containing protein